MGYQGRACCIDLDGNYSRMMKTQESGKLSGKCLFSLAEFGHSPFTEAVVAHNFQYFDNTEKEEAWLF